MKQQFSPGIVSLLPIFYVGWSDSSLGPDERALIEKKVDAMPHISAEEKNQLKKWTDQKNPPSQELYRSWLAAIKSHVKDGSFDQKISLVELGSEIAELSTNDSSKGLVRAALKELELTLGVDDHLDANILYGALGSEADHFTDSSGQELVDEIGDLLDGDHKDLINELKEFISDDFFINKDIRDKEVYREVILKQCKRLAEAGYGAFSYPEQYGGRNNPLLNTVIFETVALGDVSLLIKFGVQFGLFGGALFLLGTKKHHDLYLKQTGTLELAGCFAMTETGHGSNVKGLETTATYDEEKACFVVHSPAERSGKEYIGNAMHSKMAAVFAQLIVRGENHGVHAILVPLRDDNHELLPGVRVEDNGYKMGLNGVDNGRIWFDQVEVPRDNLLNKYGDVNEKGVYSSPIKSASRRFFTMLGALVAGRVCIALAANSTTKESLTIAIRYALKRRQFNVKDDGRETLIMDYPSHQHRLFPRLAKTYALHFGLSTLRNMYAEKLESGDMRKVESLAAGLKAVSSWHATDTIQECREACGGKGYLSENGFADLKADTDIFTTFEGDNNVLLQLVSKGLLTEFKEHFQDGGFITVLRHLSDRLSTTLIEANSFTKRNTSAGHLLDMDFQIQALEYRENSLLFSLADRMRNFIKRRLSPSETYKLVQTHMINLALASMDVFCAKEYYQAIEKLEEGESKILMLRLARLYCLDTIHKHRGWYLEQDYISGSKSKAIRKQIDYLCRKIRPDALTYVEAFRIPDTLLGAQILS